MIKIVSLSTVQPSQIEPFAIPTQNGLTLAKDVIEALRSQLSVVPLQGRAKVIEKGSSAEQKFFEMATTATQRAYSALEDLSDQTVGLDCGSGEIYLNHYIALISSLPLLSEALALEGDHDRSWALKDVKNIQWAIEDEGCDLIKAIAPEVKRANEEYEKASRLLAEVVKDPKKMFEAHMRIEEAIIHLKLITRMSKQVVKLERIADQLSGPLAGIGKVLKEHAKQIDDALSERQTYYFNLLELGALLNNMMHDHIHENYVNECIKRYEQGQSLIDFKRSMRPLFKYSGLLEHKKKVVEILAKAEGLPVDGYDYHAKNTVEMRKAYLFERMTPGQRAKYKDLTSFDSEPKGSKFAWVFLALQALVMIRGAGSLLLGYDAAALKAQADQMQKQLFSAIPPDLKTEIEKDGSRMGAILSDKWDVLQRMGEGSMQSGLLNKLSPEAKEAVQGLLKGLEKAPSPAKIQVACDAVIAARLAQQIPSPFQHMSIGEWIDLFTRAEQEEVPATATKIAGLVAMEPRTAELSANLDKWGPGIDKHFLLHLGGREFGLASGLEGYNALRMLSSLHRMLHNKLRSMADQPDKVAYTRLYDKMGRALDLGRAFLWDRPIAFAAKLDKELARLSVGENLFWQGGWTMPGEMSGHSIIYEIVKVGEDCFTFRVYNRGDGSEYHASGNLGLKEMTLGLHEVVEVKKAKLLRPAVIQGLQELERAPKEGEKWNPAELYYNILLRMEGKISNRLIPIDQTLPDISVGICSYSSLAAFFHQFLGSNRLYERLMIEFSAKAAWDYWKQNVASLRGDREGRELLKRVAKQTIQDAMVTFSNEELDLIRSRMETIIADVTRAEQQSLAKREIRSVNIQAKPHELYFATLAGKYDDLMSVEKVAPAPKYHDLQLTSKFAKEVAQLLHRGNLESRAEFVRHVAHEYVGNLPLDLAKNIAEDQALDFVSDLVQIASEFQWALHEVFTADPSRADRLTIKDALVPIKLLTIADSIARKFGLALPQMLQRHMAIVLFGMTTYSRVDDPKLEDDIAEMCAYWRKVDPQGIKENLDTSFFNFEWAPAGSPKPIYVSENIALSKHYLQNQLNCDKQWPMIDWTLGYLNAHPEKLQSLLEKQPFLEHASGVARALAALADEYTATHSNATLPDPRFGKRGDMVDVERTSRLKGVLPDMFFHLWDLSFITNYLFTGGWSSDDTKTYNENKLEAIRNLYKEDRLLKRPTRHFKREMYNADEGPIYVWKLDYRQYGHLAGDDAQNRDSLYVPEAPLSKAYGEHTGSLLEYYGFSIGGRRRELPNKRFSLAYKNNDPETAHKLFGLSSKADLQIEETLALFHANPMLLAQWEYRDLLSFMLFEQGILLDEIRKRTPQEVSELINTIAGLTDKGHQVFAKLLGNIEVQAYLLDLTAKMRHYLNYAGVSHDLPDPIPTLRKLLEDPSLKNEQRTYIRFILAKHSNDLSDIITFAIQFDLHPLGPKNEFYRAFDDEIRRDMLINRRAKIQEALMGPNRDQLLNAVVKAIMPHQPAKTWGPHGDFPLFQSDDGRITIDVLKGSYFELGHVPRELPFPIKSYLHKQKLLQAEDAGFIQAIQLDPKTYEFTLKGRRMLFRTWHSSDHQTCIGYAGRKLKCETELEHVSMGIVQKEIDGRMYQLQHDPKKIMFDNAALVHGNHVWYYSEKSAGWIFSSDNPIEALIVDQTTGKQLYRVTYEGKRAIVHQIETGYVMTQVGFLAQMEDPSWIRAWADPKTGIVRKIELPRFDLSFTLEEGYNCDQLPGYFLSPKQRHPSMGKIENYLVLDRLDRDENTHQVIVMPMQSYKESKKKALAPDAIIERRLEERSKEKYALFDVDGMKQTLTARTTEGRLFLALTHLWHHDYTLAAELIRGYGGQRAAHTEIEREILQAIYSLDQHNDDHTPQGQAVRLIAYAAAIRNRFDFDASNDVPSLDREYKKYLHQLEFVPELALTEEEEHLIVGRLGFQLPKSVAAVRIQTPAPFTLVTENSDSFFSIFSNPERSLGPGLLRYKFDGNTFLYLYQAILDKEYHYCYNQLTGTTLPKNFEGEENELVTALRMIASGGSSKATRICAHILACAIVSKQSFPTVEEIKKAVQDGKVNQAQLFKRFDLNAIDSLPQFQSASGIPPTIDREPPLPAQSLTKPLEQCAVLINSPTLQGPVIENFDQLIETKPSVKISVTAALEKIFQVETDEPVADAQLANLVRGIRAYGASEKLRPHYSVKDLEGLRLRRLALEQELFLMAGAESAACMKLMGEANRLPEDPTHLSEYLAQLASGDISPLILDDLIRKQNHPGLLQILIHATERGRRQAVVEAIKDIEKGGSPQEISNLIDRLKQLSEATRQFDPAMKPEYLVFEYYIGILLQKRQIEALDKLVQRVRRGEKIHSREFGNVLEMIMGSGKTAVLTPLIAWLEANGAKLSMVVMPEGLMPEKTEELEQRFGEAFHRSIDVLTFDRDSNFSEEGLQRLLNRLRDDRKWGKLVMVSSSSLQSLILRFIEDTLNKVGLARIDLFRQVLAEFRKHGSITFDELDAIADVLKMQIFSLEKLGVDSERQLANPQLKETTADLFKFMFTDPVLAPIVSKPLSPEVYEAVVKPRLLEEILKGELKPYRNYLLNVENIDLESMPLKNTLAVLKYQLNKMIPETFSRKVDEHFSLIEKEGVNPDTNLLSKPLEKGSWDQGSEHGTAEEGINYTLRAYLAKGVPAKFVEQEIDQLRKELLVSLEANELEKIEDSPVYAKLLALTGGKIYRLDQIQKSEIEKITARINKHDPVQIINLAMKYAVNPQLAIFPYQLRADAQMLLQIAMLSRGFSGTLWNWQTFASRFQNVELSDTEAKTLHLLQASSPQAVTIVEGDDFESKIDQLFMGKPSVAIADAGNIFAEEKSEGVAKVILEKGPWKDAPYYDEDNKLIIAAGVAKEDRAPYWKQELCTGSDIPLGTTAEAVVTFGRYTMMRDLLQTVWRLRQLDRGQKVRFAVAAADSKVIIATLEKLLKQKIEKLELSHLFLYAAYIQAMRIGDDNHRSLGQQLRAQLIGEVFDVIIQPEVPPEQVIEIIEATQDLFITAIDPNPYNRYGTRESMLPAREVVEAELKEVLESKTMKALREHPVLKKYCDAAQIEKDLRAIVDAMMPHMAKKLASPTDTGIHHKVKTKTKSQTKTETETKTKTDQQVRAKVQKDYDKDLKEPLPWTKELLFGPDIKSRQVKVSEVLGHHFDPRLLSSLNRMRTHFDDPVTNHALLIENGGEISMMLLDQDDTSDIQALLHQSPPNARMALINLVTDKVWRQSNNPFTLEEIQNNLDIQGLKAQAKLVNGMLSYTEAEQKALSEFLTGKDVKALREWFSETVIGNRQRTLKRFPHSDIERIFQANI